jgi:hypothetical protein
MGNCLKNVLPAISGCPQIQLRISERTEGRWAAIILDKDGDMVLDASGSPDPEAESMDAAQALAVRRAMVYRNEPIEDARVAENCGALRLLWIPC